jgi:exopolysaccharide biosynthesis WecB/TagA/CpsF family protein
VAVNVDSQDDLLQDIEERLKCGTGFAVATLNLDHVVKLHKHVAFQDAYMHHTHVTADGKPVVWLTRLAGGRVDLVTGSDLIDPVAALAARLGVGVALIGTTEASLQRASDELARRYPGFTAVTRISPANGFDPVGPVADNVIREIGRSGARLCFISLGAPKQEVFAARARAALPDVGFLSVGAGIDFISGAQRRAPLLARRFAVEWLWRLVLEPGRLASRYAACATYLPRLTFEAMRIRLATDGGLRRRTESVRGE